MNHLLIILDGPSLGGLLGVFTIFIVVPIVAIILLIIYFVRRNKRKRG